MTGDIVRSLAGRDKDEFFCVLREEGEYLFLCDGKSRKLDHPKRKKEKHTAAMGKFDHPALEKLRRHEPVTDHELRKAMAAFRAQAKEGMTLWQKSI